MESSVDHYGDLPRITVKVRERRMRLAGHCVRDLELEESKSTMGSTQGKAKKDSNAPPAM